MHFLLELYMKIVYLKWGNIKYSMFFRNKIDNLNHMASILQT